MIHIYEVAFHATWKLCEKQTTSESGVGWSLYTNPNKHHYYKGKSPSKSSTPFKPCRDGFSFFLTWPPKKWFCLRKKQFKKKGITWVNPPPRSTAHQGARVDPTKITLTFKREMLLYAKRVLEGKEGSIPGKPWQLQSRVITRKIHPKKNPQIQATPKLQIQKLIVYPKLQSIGRVFVDSIFEGCRFFLKKNGCWPDFDLLTLRLVVFSPTVWFLHMKIQNGPRAVINGK